MDWWNDEIKNNLITILQSIRDDRYEGVRHYKFITAYQLAIAFAQNYPEEFQNIPVEVGGKNTGVHRSLAKRITQSLIDEHVQIATWADDFVGLRITFKDDDASVIPSTDYLTLLRYQP